MSNEQKQIRKFLHEKLGIVFANGQERNDVVDAILVDVILDLYSNYGANYTFYHLDKSMQRVLYSRIVKLV